MLSNFDSWRKAREQQTQRGCSLMHYYRFEDSSLHFVVSIIQRVLVGRVEQGSPYARIFLDDATCATFLAFCEQAQFGYIHPRRTSAKFLFAREQTPPLLTH